MPSTNGKNRRLRSPSVAKVLLCGMLLLAGGSFFAGGAAAQNAQRSQSRVVETKVINALIGEQRRAQAAHQRRAERWSPPRQRWQSNTIRHLPSSQRPRYWEPR